MRIYTVDLKDGAYVVLAGMEIDCDGSPHAYNPTDTGLDYLANGGPRGNPYGYELNPATGQPFRQGFDAPLYDDTCKGYFVSSTTYRRAGVKANDPRAYLNAETELFIVVPGAFRKHVPGIVMGCAAIVNYKGTSVTAVVGDVGPDFGEGSMALAEKLGIPPNPRNGGVVVGVTYRIYPGVVANGYTLQPA